MPDLPSDLFDDEDQSYALDDTSGDVPGDETWDEEYPGYGVDDIVDQRPRRRERRPEGVRGSISGRRATGNEEPGYEPPKRKRRRQPREDIFEQPQRRTVRRPARRDDDIMDASKADGYAEEIAPSPRRQGARPEPVVKRPPSRQDRVLEQPRMRASAVTGDVITSIRPAEHVSPSRPRARRQRNPAWRWESIVMPQPRQMVVQAWPSLLMAISVLGTLAVIGFIPGGLPLWAPMILVPTLVLLLRADHARHPVWGRAALVNLAVVGAFFPLMIVRQSFMRVPFVEFGNGTLVMPVAATVLVIGGMAVIALAAAFLSQEDPEYAGMLFLPAAMLVPLFAGANEITGLSTALLILGVIYLAVGGLTVIASMLPAAFPTLVAPVALALEFFVLPVSEGAPIFPLGAGMSAKLLFFAVLGGWCRPYRGSADDGRVGPAGATYRSGREREQHSRRCRHRSSALHEPANANEPRRSESPGLVSVSQEREGISPPFPLLRLPGS